MGYLQQICDNFSKTALTDKRVSVADGGAVVFLEANGDLTNAKTGAPYNNVYVFKFTFSGSKISHIAEYANPVTFAKGMGLPVG